MRDRCGRLASRAAQYHGGDFAKSRAAAFCFLADYKGSPVDSRLEDEISGLTQEEFFTDAQGVWGKLDEAVHSIAGLVSMVPLVGRTLTIRPITDGADMNPWLLEVVGMPSLVRVMTGYDLLHTSPAVLNMRVNCDEDGEESEPWHEQYDQWSLNGDSEGEEEESVGKPADPKGTPPAGTINHLLLLPNSARGAAWMHHAATFLLLRNEGLFHFDAWVSTMAATVTYLLGQDMGKEWVRAELGRVMAAFDEAYPPDAAPRLFQYAEALAGGDFRRCLAAGGQDHPKHLECPHLTKYILCLVICLQARPRSGEWLMERYQGLVVEFFHRSQARFRFRRDLRDHEAWAAQNLPTPGREALQACRSFAEAEALFVPPAQAKVRAATAEELGLHGPHLDAASVDGWRHYQFTLSGLERVFQGLKALLVRHNHEAVGLSFDGVRGDPRVLGRLLLAGEISDNLRRSAAPLEPLSDDELYRLTTLKALRSCRARAFADFYGRFNSAFLSAAAASHRGVAPALPPRLIKQFRQEFHVDLREHFAVGFSGLPTVCCVFPGCPFYMQRLGPARLGRSGGFCINKELAAHLGPVRTVPGLHKTLRMSERCILVEDERRLAERVVGGHHLIKVAHQARWNGRLAKLRQDLLLRGMQPLQAEGILRRKREDLERSRRMEDKIYGGNLQRRVTTALKEHSLAQDQELMDYIAHTRDAEEGWAYADFREAMLCALRCPASGRFLALPRPGNHP